MAKLQTLAVALCLSSLLLLAPVAIRAEEDDGVDEKDVVVLTKDNFDETVNGAKFALVEFYAPWCGHCKTLKPEYAKAATELKAAASDVVLGKVDATEQSEVAGRFGVQGYPTLKWFINGEVNDYGGGRTAAEIVTWIKKKTGPPAVTLKSVIDTEDLIEGDKVFLLGYFKALEGEEHKAFEALGQKTEDIEFYQTTDADVAKALGLTTPGTFAVGRAFPDAEFEAVSSEGHPAFEGDGELAEELEAFMTAEKLPVFMEFTQENQPKIFGSGINKQMIVLAPKSAWDSKDDELAQSLRKVYDAHKGKLVIVAADPSSDGAAPIINYFGAKKDHPHVQILGYYSDTQRKFTSKEGASPEGLMKFTEGLLEGNLPVEYKSADIPDDDTDGDVQIVVGKSFDDIVMDPSKDVLLEVYAPWCGHCKALAPVYKKLAKRFKKIDSVVIANMDGTQNEHAAIDGMVKGFPAILLFPATEDKKPIVYDSGDRSLKALTQFMKKNAVIEFELEKKSKDAKEDTKEDTKDEL